MPLTYVGKVTFSDLVPGLAQAAEQVLAHKEQVQEAIDKASAGLTFLEKKRAAVEAELDRATQQQ